VHFYFPNSVKAVAIARRPDINGRSGTAVFLGVRETIVKQRRAKIRSRTRLTPPPRDRWRAGTAREVDWPMAGSIRRIERRGSPSYVVRVEYPPDPATGERRQRSKSYRAKKDAEKAL
jgi:hypothetical protein